MSDPLKYQIDLLVKYTYVPFPEGISTWISHVGSGIFPCILTPFLTLYNPTRDQISSNQMDKKLRVMTRVDTGNAP